MRSPCIRGAHEVLALYPGGYPLHIEVRQQDIGGAGTAMRFTLPPHGHNFPLTHARETKLVAALDGRLALRSGGGTALRLAPGQAVILPAGSAHRIAQEGDGPATVGVALWPGAVEEAFRELARRVAAHGFARAEAIAILAQYGVAWDAGARGAPALEGLQALPLAQAALRAPPPLRQALAACWPAAFG